MATPPYKVSVITVTYGNRWQFLQQVLNRVLSLAQVAQVVVVDNASGYSVADKVSQIGDDRVIVLSNTENQGSAGGYKAGIAFAIKSTIADMLWLLDDDNLPDEKTLDGLLAEWDNIDGPDNKKAVFCLREDRGQHVKIAKGEDPGRYYLVRNNFLGFSITNILRNQWYKLYDIFKNNRPYLPKAKIPYVPYGGLMLHKSMIAGIGLPNEAFFVYADDSEYTYRITQNGGTIWLIPSCRVSDIDKSQGVGYKSKLFHSQLLDQWSFRTYYIVRNRTYFYSQVAIQNKIAFKINKTLYLTYLQIVSLLSCRVKEYKKLVQAINDGLNAKLGKTNKDKF